MKNEFDNRLTDKGWRSMRGVLDREMPAKKRRRPLAWWLLGVFILAAGAGGWLWHRSVKAAPPPGRAVEKAVARQPVVDAGGNERQARMQPDKPGTALPAVLPAAGIRESARHETGSSSGRKGSIAGLNGAALAVSPEKQAETPVFTASVPEVPGSPVNMASLAALPEKDRYPRPETPARPVFSQVNPVEQAVVKKKTNASRRWSVGIAAGIHSENLSGLNGFSSGVAVDWQFSRKWGLRTGIRYARYRPSVQERPVVSIDNTEYADATGNFAVIQDVINNPSTGSPSIDPSYQKVLVPVDRLQRLEMPLLAFWQPVRSLRLYGGATVSRNLSAKASMQNYANNKVYLADNKNALSNLNSLTSSTLSRWQANALFGAGLRFGKRFELDAFYQPVFGHSGSGNGALQDLGGSFSGGASPVSGNTGGIDGHSRFFLNGILFF